MYQAHKPPSVLSAISELSYSQIARYHTSTYPATITNIYLRQSVAVCTSCLDPSESNRFITIKPWKMHHAASTIGQHMFCRRERAKIMKPDPMHNPRTPMEISYADQRLMVDGYLDGKQGEIHEVYD